MTVDEVIAESEKERRREAAILSDAQAMVEAGEARWIGNGDRG
jgi:hypothetical protein